LAVKEYLHKYQDRWNVEESKKTFSGTRGTFEESEGLPASHPRKRTAISPPITVAGGPVVIAVTANMTMYITHIQMSWNDVAGANCQIDVADAGTGNLIHSFTGAAIAVNLNLGDGSAVVAQATTNVLFTPTAGGGGMTGHAVITYYELPTL